MQQEIRRQSIIEINLNGVVWLLQTDKKIDCIVRDLTEDFSEIGIILFEPLVNEEENAELGILLPTERSPIKCNGTITKYPEEKRFSTEKQETFIAQLAVDRIGRIDQRRLELFIVHKRAFISGGESQNPVF